MCYSLVVFLLGTVPNVPTFLERAAFRTEDPVQLFYYFLLLLMRSSELQPCFSVWKCSALGPHMTSAVTEI